MISLDTRVHGSFGAFIPMGIGSVWERLIAGTHEVTVLYFDNEKSPMRGELPRASSRISGRIPAHLSGAQR